MSTKKLGGGFSKPIRGFRAAPGKKRTAVQEALLGMRRRLKLTQHGLPTALNMAPVSVARWESTRSPSGASAALLANFAQQRGDPQAAAIFRKASETIPYSSLLYGSPLEPALTSTESEAHQIERAPIMALEQILEAAKSDSSLLPGYRELLEGLWKIHQMLLHRAVEGTGDLTQLASVHKYLQKEREKLDERLKETKTEAKR